MGDRYGNSFCRHLDCVALLDFGPTAVDDWGQFKNWSGWFGDQQQARVAVWLEIDRRAAAENVIDAGALHRKWKDNCSKQIIPGVEAGHRGPVPVGFLRDRADRYGAEPIVDFGGASPRGSVAKSGYLVTCLRDLPRGVEA